VPLKFTGKIEKLTIALDRPRLTPEDEKRLREAELSGAGGAEIATAMHRRWQVNAPRLPDGRFGDSPRCNSS